jgi:predicted nuclease of restriction endonuclease-like (RecB) superfamily
MKRMSEKNDLLQVDVVVKDLYSEISSLIDRAKLTIQQTVNSKLTLLNWEIGNVIKTEILKNSRGEYGEQVIAVLTKSLSFKYGKGYSRSSIFRMIQFVSMFSEKEIVATLSRQLSWSHFVELLRIEDNLKRRFYVTMSQHEGWSVRTLRGRISSALYERTNLSKKPEKTIANDLKLLEKEKIVSKEIFFKDPYILDFLGLEDTYSEKDLESAIISELGKFILEMGKDLAFLERQKRIVVDGKDYYIDLLFFHRRMRRLVVVELKLDEFKPEHKGQVELYLKWLDKNERIKGEESPIGMILCAKKSVEVIELLELDKSGIHVAEYFSDLPSKKMLEEKLLEIIERAQLRLEQRIK